MELENKLISYLSTTRIDQTIVTSALAMTPLADANMGGRNDPMAMASKLAAAGAAGPGAGGPGVAGKRMSIAQAVLDGTPLSVAKFPAAGGVMGSMTSGRSSRLGAIPDQSESIPSITSGLGKRFGGSVGSLLNGPFASDAVLPISGGGAVAMAQTALDVAMMGSPLTLQLQKGGGGAGPVDREFAPDKRTGGYRGRQPPQRKSFLDKLIFWKRDGRVHPIDEATTLDQTKKLVVDVVLRMTAKVDRMGRTSSASSQRYMRVIYSEIRSLKIHYHDDLLESKYRSDFTSSTWSLFLRGAAQAFFCEIIFLVLAIYNTIATGNTFVEASPTFYAVITCCAASAGLQMLLVGVAVFGAGDEDPNDDFSIRVLMFLYTVFTFTTAAFTIVMPWSGLHSYPYLTGTVIPTLLFVFIIRLDGMLFYHKVLAATITTLSLVITVLCLHHASWKEAFFVFTTCWIWVAIEMLVERSRRIEYLLGLILDTQEELVADETAKSASVLHSILPQSVIYKLLIDPASIVYEEFDMMSVLHMDVAGWVFFCF